MLVILAILVITLFALAYVTKNKLNEDKNEPSNSDRKVDQGIVVPENMPDPGQPPVIINEDGTETTLEIKEFNPEDMPDPGKSPAIINEDGTETTLEVQETVPDMPDPAESSIDNDISREVEVPDNMPDPSKN